MLTHVGNDVTAHQNRAVEIDLDRVYPLRPIDLIDRSLRTVDAGVVDEDLQPSEFANGAIDQSSGVLFARDVCHFSDHLLSGAGESLEMLMGVVEASFVAGANENVGALAHKGTRDLEAEPLIRAGDDGAASFEFHDGFPTA